MEQGKAQTQVDIAAVLLLAGGVSRSPLQRAAGRACIELPVASGFSILDCWHEQVERLAVAGAGRSRLRLLVDQDSPAPAEDGRFELLRDRGEIRGAGGALRDATLDLPEDAYVLAAPASQILSTGLDGIVSRLVAKAGCVGRCDAVLGVNGDGTPGSVLLARVGSLRRIQDVGFVDLKEQALPLLAKHGEVRAVRFADRPALSARTPREYLGGLRKLAGGNEEAWNAVFSVVEPGASVSSDVMLHDSVVLGGATVGAGAVLVRCLACPGATIAAGAVCVDKVLTADVRPVATRRRVAA